MSIKLTEALKKWLQEQVGLTADATDEEARKAAADALFEGSLERDKFIELTTDPDAQKATAIETKLDQVLSAVAEQGKRLSALESNPKVEDAPPKKAEPKISEKAPLMPKADGNSGRSFFEQIAAGSDGASLMEDSSARARVISAHERYQKSRSQAMFPSFTQTGARHPFAGQPVFEGERENKRYINHPSELDTAISGAYFKWMVNLQLRGQVPYVLRMTDHDRELVQYAIKELPWGGVLRGDGSEAEGAIGLHGEKLSEWQQKALIDDSTSGGLEAAPIVFDDAIILTPLLFGEFFPRVNVVNITRGRRVEGVSAGNVTLSSGGVDATAIPLFSTASFVSAFDTTIFVANGCIEVGLDFMSDSPLNWGNIITEQYGRQLLTWLDTQICTGDGTTEPEGVTVASGTTSVSSTNGAGGPPTVGDYESLLFGVGKAYKQGYPKERLVYGANETTYRRARAIYVSTTDARRVFGMTHEDYMLFGHPYGISASHTNAQCWFANLARYRMYRRLGLTTKVTTEGRTLVRANEMLISCRARFGGQIEAGAAVAYCSDMQS